MTLVPRPGADSMSTVPPESVTMPCTVASPRPVPWPGSLVVKKGSKARSRTSSAMPVPSSTTVMRTPSATPATAIASVPPSGIASRALTARLTSTCSSCARSASTGSRPGPDRDAQRDALAQRAVEQALEVAQQAADVEHLGLDHLAAAEHEQLARERRGAVGRAPDLLDVVADRVVGGQLARGEADAGEDHRQQVVEVVGDAARELADALQALGLGQAMLELGALLGAAAALGDVGGDGDHRGDVARRRRAAGT